MEQPQEERKLSALWTKMNNAKSTIMHRAESYALWTLPYICPPSNHKDQELQNTLDGMGARAANHLSNKVVLALYPAEGSFLRLDIDDMDIQLARQSATQGDTDAIELLRSIDNALVLAERSAIRILDKNRFRVEAITAAKSLIIVGNALQYIPKDGENVQTFMLRDYCVKRDLSGKVIRILIKDAKAMSTFEDDIKQKLIATGNSKYKKSDCDVTLYTYLEWRDGKYHMSQSADDINLDSKGSWTEEECPYIVLAWNLIRGEDYGRGLVEDFAGTFHALYVLNQSFVDAAGIAADIKWLVNPGSVINVKELNDSKSGSYHSGMDGDVTALQVNKTSDLNVVLQAIERLERQIAQAFLLNSSITRQAERVTAEEIRDNIRELETAHSGVYSRLAFDWQLPLAKLLLAQVDIKVQDNLDVKIITGAESLSRQGDLDSVRGWIGDLALLQAVPEEFRGRIEPSAFAEYLAVRRNLDATKFLKSSEQIQSEQDAAMAQQQQIMSMQTEQDVATEAGKSMVKGE